MKRRGETLGYLMVVLMATLACRLPGGDGDGDATPTATPDVPEGAFVREKPMTTHGLKGGDACAYLGGMGMVCLDALLAEKDPAVRAWMRRLSDAAARLTLDERQGGSPVGVGHAEVAMACADSGPCKPSETVNDDGFACLTKAETALLDGDAVASRKAHARACQCGSERAQIPVMGGVLACAGITPENRGTVLSTVVATDVMLCGRCDPAKGLEACRREVERLAGKQPAVARYLAERHVPRCQQP